MHIVLLFDQFHNANHGGLAKKGSRSHLRLLWITGPQLVVMDCLQMQFGAAASNTVVTTLHLIARGSCDEYTERAHLLNRAVIVEVATFLALTCTAQGTISTDLKRDNENMLQIRGIPTVADTPLQFPPTPWLTQPLYKIHNLPNTTQYLSNKS